MFKYAVSSCRVARCSPNSGLRRAQKHLGTAAVEEAKLAMICYIKIHYETNIKQINSQHDLFTSFNGKHVLGRVRQSNEINSLLNVSLKYFFQFPKIFNLNNFWKKFLFSWKCFYVAQMGHHKHAPRCHFLVFMLQADLALRIVRSRRNKTWYCCFVHLNVVTSGPATWAKSWTKKSNRL